MYLEVNPIVLIFIFFEQKLKNQLLIVVANVFRTVRSSSVLSL